jgi:sensor domain CHASE-containing protein
MAPPRYDFGPSRRRRSPLPIVLLALLAALAGLFVWLGMRESSVPQQRIEQDVTNEVLK